MTPEQESLLKKARERLGAARLLYESGYMDDAASRAYYAMFYVAQAFLEGEGLSFSKHSAVIAAFGGHFARAGRVPAELHNYLRQAFDVRHSGDYGPVAVPPGAAAEQIARAQQFLELAERLIGPIPPPGEERVEG